MRLTDAQWELLQPLFDPPSASPGRGRPPIDERPILEAILWKISHNAAWDELPSEYPSHQTCYRRYRKWRRSDLLGQVLDRLKRDLHKRGGFDLQSAVQGGLITFTITSHEFQVRIPPELHHTWQLRTALIFIGLALRRSHTTRPVVLIPS